MVYLLRPAFVLFLSLLTVTGSAQYFNPSQAKRFTIIPDTVILDSLSLVPGSVKLKLYPENDSARMPVIDYARHALIFTSKTKPDSFSVIRVLFIKI